MEAQQITSKEEYFKVLPHYNLTISQLVHVIQLASRFSFIFRKIKSKYLLLEIMSYSYFQDRALFFLYQISNSSRILMRNNKSIILKNSSTKSSLYTKYFQKTKSQITLTSSTMSTSLSTVHPTPITTQRLIQSISHLGSFRSYRKKYQIICLSSSISTRQHFLILLPISTNRNTSSNNWLTKRLSITIILSKRQYAFLLMMQHIFIKSIVRILFQSSIQQLEKTTKSLCNQKRLLRSPIQSYNYRT
ncbi:hypothetical protein FGO68_gene5623 [Halteria grandinella]|uniref:Uncharacterized protein n=1 Tax=Halteria grandinella TaxID=5974 RepID=A0A8J8T945_HALGN|nr:hypothetical protein FGO68_gene5623 [Halteria grandinella]